MFDVLLHRLNAETYCGREGSVFFGDGVNGYVLSYMFTVYDAQSRGHRVKYTIMTMMTDRVYLVASMDYLISLWLTPSVRNNLRRHLDLYHIPRLTIEGPSCPRNECTLQDTSEERPVNGESGEQTVETIDSLRELRRGILPKECRNVILDVPAYEPSYACNILGLDRSVAIPSNMDPQDFILLDVCMNTFGHQIPTPPTSLPASNHQKNGSAATPNSIYQADWSSATLVADLKDLSSNLEKAVLSEQNQGVEHHRAPTSSPGLLYSPGGGFQAQRRRYLLQAGEEPPEALEPTFVEENGKDAVGRKTMVVHSQQSPLYIETVNDILDLKMPKSIESKRLAVLREEWIGKSRQFHNLKKAGYASNQSVVDQFLQSMRVDKRDLKILRFFTRCARSSSLQSQKYMQDDLMTSAAFAINRSVSD
ncbi:hypothetical protein BGZ68_002765 [Mortierella alpina]|nr:hypothetical protein BGZ68_002765 [Mortierella alpina]